MLREQCDLRCCLTPVAPSWTQEIMTEPVLCADGQTYERAAIASWFEQHDTSPLTNAVVLDKCLRPKRIPNNALRPVIGLFRRHSQAGYS